MPAKAFVSLIVAVIAAAAATVLIAYQFDMPLYFVGICAAAGALAARLWSLRK